MYLGRSDIVAHDAGKNFTAKSIKTNSDLLHIRTKPVPIEAPNSMTIVEQYHEPVRLAHCIIMSEAPDMDKEAALQSTVKEINDYVGPDRLVPTLLVHGALPGLGVPNEKPIPSMYHRASAVRRATQEMVKMFATRQIKAALNCRN